MDRKDLLKIVVLVGTAIMVGSMLAPGLLRFGLPGSGPVAGEILSGIAVFNGTIRTYEPFLVVTGQLPESVKNKLLLDEGVRSVNPSSEGHVINVTTRDDVYPVAQLLKKDNIESTTVANIILPVSVELKLSNGTKTKVVSVGTVQVWTEPLVDVDTTVIVSMVASAQDGRLLSYSSAVLLADKVDVSGNATVVSLLGKEYSFTVPWEKRDQVDETALKSKYGNASVKFTRNDYVSFPTSLTVAQITDKKNLAYITFISDTGASISKNFTNKTQVLSDFGNITAVFPDSDLRLITNKTVDLPFNSTLLNSYSISLPSSLDGYSLDSKLYQLKLSKDYSVNETVNVTVSGTAIGNRIVKVESIKAG